MGIPLQKLLSKLPKETQQKIKSKAENYIREYESLALLRKDLGITQEEVAHAQGVRQVNISNLLKRNDMLISTLNKYVAALGGDLEIQIRFPDDNMATIKQFKANKGERKIKRVQHKRKAKGEVL